MNNLIEIEIVGTYVEKYKVGEIYYNAPIDRYEQHLRANIKILKEVTEADWREKYDYHGPIPKDPLGRKPKYFEVVALPD